MPSINDLPPPPGAGRKAAGIDDLPPPPSGSLPEESFSDRIRDPERWQAILMGTGPKAPEVVAGTPPLAIPAASAPSMLLKAADAINKTATRRVVAQTAAGAISNPEDPMTGAAIGLGSSLFGEGMGALAKGGKHLGARAARFTGPQADAYIANPKGVTEMANMLDDEARMPDLQDAAANVVKEGRAKLQDKGLEAAAKLKELLSGKSVELDIASMGGISPEADAILANARAARSTDPLTAFRELGRPNTKLVLDANDANQLKRALQSVANYKPLPGTVLDPAVVARSTHAGSQASMVKKSIESLDPAIRTLNEEMQQGMLHQQALRQGGKARPLAYLSSEAPDSMAALARADRSGAEGLTKFGKEYGAAKNIAVKDTDDAVPRYLAKTAGRMALRATPVIQNGGKTVAVLGGVKTASASRPDVADVQPDVDQQSVPILSKSDQDRSPAKGEARWAQSGAKRLGLSPDQTAKLMQSKEMKRLLIEASDLRDGSPALQRIKDQIQKGKAR